MVVLTPSLFANTLLLKFQERVRNELKESATIHHYTPHGLSHIQGVEASVEYLGTLVPPANAFSPLEMTLLRFCAWSHDLGMIRTIAERYQATFGEESPYRPELLRKDHDKASAHYLQVTIPELLRQIQTELKQGAPGQTRDMVREKMLADLGAAGYAATGAHLDFFADEDNSQRWGSNAVSLAHTVTLIARYHRRAEAIDGAPLLRHFIEEPVRVRFLAALFRLADALHVDRTRFEQTGYDMLVESPQFTDESRVHWIKSFIVSSIRINAAEHTVHVQADIPAAHDVGGRQFGIESDRLRGMLAFIVNDLSDDVQSVSRILLKEGLPPLLGVTHEVHEIPAMLYPQDVRAALNHLFATSSPNTSRLVSIALDVLRWHLGDSTKHRESVDELQKKIRNQIRSIDEQLVDRPCHEALWKVRDLLGAVSHVADVVNDPEKNDFRVLRDHYGTWRIIYALLDGIHGTFDKQRSTVKTDAADPGLLSVFDKCTDIVVYGFSDQALLLLKSLNSSPAIPPAVHVLECRTKTTYAAAGDLIYLDGDSYARALLKEIHYRGAVTIEPDAALARILDDVRDGERAVVLLGTNAIYPDGTFVHSMGHLTVASVAKAPHLAKRCSVVVLTDSMKIGFYRNEQIKERHENAWLTHKKEVVTALKEAGVILHNWQQDTVPTDLIDTLLVLDGAKKFARTSQSLVEARFDAAQVRFDAPGRYCETLSPRLLASYLDRAKGWLPADVQNEVRRLGRMRDHLDANLGNWRVAEAYCENRNLPQGVRDWIAREWDQRTATEIERLKRTITEAYYRLVESRRPKVEEEREPAAVVDIAAARLSPRGSETGPPPTGAPSSGVVVVES